MRKKNFFFPIVVTVLILLIISYLFINIKQPYVECTKTTVDDNNIKITEELKAGLDGNKISSIYVEKTIVIPDTIPNRDSFLESTKFALEHAYEYLGDNVEIVKNTDRVIVKANLDKKGTIILNNIEFINNGELSIKINSNTKSSDVITLSIKDKYTEGELMSRMKNNSYVCR